MQWVVISRVVVTKCTVTGTTLLAVHSNDTAQRRNTTKSYSPESHCYCRSLASLHFSLFFLKTHKAHTAHVLRSEPMYSNEGVPALEFWRTAACCPQHYDDPGEKWTLHEISSKPLQISSPLPVSGEEKMRDDCRVSLEYDLNGMSDEDLKKNCNARLFFIAVSGFPIVHLRVEC